VYHGVSGDGRSPKFDGSDICEDFLGDIFHIGILQNMENMENIPPSKSSFFHIFRFHHEHLGGYSIRHFQTHPKKNIYEKLVI
jgi:hypothetical protein